MRVLLTCPSLRDHGGVAAYVNSLIPYITIGGTDVSTLEIGSTAASGGLFHPLIDVIRVFGALLRNRYDLVQINPSFNLKSFLRAGLYILLAKLRGVRVLVFFHGWRKSFERVAERWLRPIFFLTYQRADAFIVLGASFAERLRGWGITCPVHLETTAVDDQLIKDFSLMKKEKLFRDHDVKLLFLSSLLKQKGIFELLEAVKIMKGDGVDLSLTVAGDGPEKDRIRRMVDDPPLRDTVTLTGYIEGAQKAEIFSAHHIFCFPSWDEGMPTCVLEAMILGLPVVATPVGALTDFFIEGKMGRLVPVRDPARLAIVIEEMAADLPALKRMALFNHEYAMRRFPASLVAKRLRMIYSKTVRRMVQD